MPPWTATAGGVSLAVRVQPKARHESIGGLAASADGERLRIAVTAAPEDGKATAAAAAALARALAVAAGRVTLVRGAASREKTFHIAGDSAELMARLERL